MTTQGAALVEVHLRELPLQLWSQTREHNDALHRELALVASSTSESLHGVPHRLLELVATIDAWRTDVSSRQDDALYAALAQGREQVEDLVYELDEQMAAAAEALIAVYAEADRWCADGRYLLTMPPTPGVVSFRTWALRQFADQPHGRPATAWSAWSTWRRAHADDQQAQHRP